MSWMTKGWTVATTTLAAAAPQKKGAVGALNVCRLPKLLKIELLHLGFGAQVGDVVVADLGCQLLLDLGLHLIEFRKRR